MSFVCTVNLAGNSWRCMGNQMGNLFIYYQNLPPSLQIMFPGNCVVYLHLQFFVRFPPFDRCEQVDQFEILCEESCIQNILWQPTCLHPSEGGNRKRNRSKNCQESRSRNFQKENHRDHRENIFSFNLVEVASNMHSVLSTKL